MADRPPEAAGQPPQRLLELSLSGSTRVARDPSRHTGSGRCVSSASVAPVDSNAGFTLIELMIVVAIIGLLASIAIPNFLHFQCKSKQAEVKSGLGALFVSEKTFFAERNTYSTDLAAIVWTPEAAPLYLYGFGTSVQYPLLLPEIPSYNPGQNNTYDSTVIALGHFNTSRMKDLAGSALSAGALPFTTCTGDLFIMGAAGDVNPDPTTQTDLWIIDTSRQFTNTRNDCTS